MAKKEYNWEILTKGETIFEATIQPRVLKFLDYLRGNSKSLKQSYAAIFLSILTDLLAGLFLGHAEEFLTLLPGLIVLVPAALGMRGQIFAALGSRLGSALHIGTITKFDRRNNVIKNNVCASMALTIIFSVFLGLLAKAVLFAFNMPSISVTDLVLISLIGGVLSGVIMLALTIFITFFSVKRNWDPDNLTSPMITALGDFFTVPTLLVGAIFVMNGHFSSNFVALFIMVSVAALVFASIFFVENAERARRMREASYRHIVAQSSMVLIFTLFLDSLSGVIIETNLHILVSIPILLVVLPAFLEEGGNVGNIMASRLATKLHLGTIEGRLTFSRDVKLEFLHAYILTTMIFLTVAATTTVFSLATGIGGLTAWQLLSVSMLAGFLLTTIVVLVTFFVSVLSYRLNIDPDNSAIPVITSVADVAGIFCLLAVLGFLHIV